MPAMECLMMSTIDGGHYQPQIPSVRAASADGYFLRDMRGDAGLPEVIEELGSVIPLVRPKCQPTG